MILSILMISFSPLLMVYSNLMLFLRSLAWCLYLLIFLKFWLSFPRDVPTSVVLERVILPVSRGEIFSLFLVSGFHCAVEPVISLSECDVVDVFVGDLIHCCVYEFTAVVSADSHYFRLSGLLVNFDCVVHGVLKSFDPRVNLYYFVRQFIHSVFR